MADNPPHTIFSDQMRLHREREERVMIVFGDACRRAAVWQQKGLSNRVVCEGLFKAALAHIYEEESPREWLSLFRHVIEQAQIHENQVREGLLKKPPPE